ncbi:ATP synthase F1 subunit epsilon [bacterium]|nr:ATP synthase F1 subunit epsilon [bacterium]NBX51033.1 ATP synthase F1 subunit epsilon [bacterium]
MLSMVQYSIITPERTVAEGEARQISISTQKGEITIRPGHAELTTLLAPGEMRVITPSGEEMLLAVSTGILRIAKNALTILADTAERSEELTLEAIERAKQEADQALKNVRVGDEVAYAAAAALLEREVARYRVALKGRRKR